MAENEAVVLPPAGQNLSKIIGLFGITATLIGNIAAIATHFDELRALFLKWLGVNYFYEIHEKYVYFFMFILGLGYVLCSLWAYKNYISGKNIIIQTAFCIASMLTISGLTIGSYLLFRPVKIIPLVEKSVIDMTSTLISRQNTGEARSAKGGFRFLQAGAGGEAQVWTTAQCLLALLTGTSAEIKSRSSNIRDGFDFIESGRIKGSNGGWGYVSQSNWAVTEINGWVSLSYIMSLRVDAAGAVWDRAALPEVLNRTINDVVSLSNRQNEDGGWGPIEKTSKSRHNRIYSTIMVIWPIVELLRTPSITQQLSGEQSRYLKESLKNGIEWLFANYNHNPDDLSGWWPNPSVKTPPDFFPGLSAQVLYVLKRAQALDSSLVTRPLFNTIVKNDLLVEDAGNKLIKGVLTRDVSSNQRAHDSDRYLESRAETVESSTFLWWPWSSMFIEELRYDSFLAQEDKPVVDRLSNAIIRRITEFQKFAEADPVIYPTAEGVLAMNLYLSATKRNSSTIMLGQEKIQ